MCTIRDDIATAIREIIASKGRAAPELSEDDALVAGLGLDSLDLAVLVVKLERRFGCDPFRNGRDAVTTFGQFVAVYEQARGGSA